MSRPEPQLDRDRDWKSLYRVNSYLYEEYMRVAKPSQFFWNWKAYRRWRKLGVTLDVMHALSKELRHRGQLTSPTMFTSPADLHPNQEGNPDA